MSHPDIMTVPPGLDEINSLRTELAIRDCDTTPVQQTRSMKEIAGLLGFSELSAFSRWFRTEFGSSPTAWRAGRGNGAQPA